MSGKAITIKKDVKKEKKKRFKTLEERRKTHQI